jgi:hypothetical protein
MSAIRKLVLFLLFFTAMLPVLMPHPLPKRTPGFSLEAILASLPFHPEWEGRASSDHEKLEVTKALSQSYRYLGSGGQCFSFVSDDGKYVIKFIKQKAFDIPIWMNHFPLPFLIDWRREKKRAKRDAKRDKVFTAFKLSFDHLSSETGLLYVHLNQTEHLNKELSFCDAVGKMHLLNLDELEFVIQKKADLAYHTLDSLMEKKDIEGAKLAIDELLLLNVNLYQKGFRNRDANFRSNCGFIPGTQAILIDVGRVVFTTEIKDPKNYKEELLRITPKFRLYLSTQYPDLLPHFDQSIAEILNSD